MIQGKNIDLRLVKESDFGIVTEYLGDIKNRGDYENFDFTSEVSLRKQYNDSGFWSEDFGVLQIVDKEDSLLGFISYFKPFTRPTRAGLEVGYAIYKSENFGKGHTTEAVSLFVAFLFETKAVNRIQATTHPENKASQRVLEKCGFKFEGLLRQAYINRGQVIDSNLYSIIRSECPALADLMG